MAKTPLIVKLYTVVKQYIDLDVILNYYFQETADEKGINSQNQHVMYVKVTVNKQMLE